MNSNHRNRVRLVKHFPTIKVFDDCDSNDDDYSACIHMFLREVIGQKF